MEWICAGLLREVSASLILGPTCPSGDVLGGHSEVGLGVTTLFSTWWRCLTYQVDQCWWANVKMAPPHILVSGVGSLHIHRHVICHPCHPWSVPCFGQLPTFPLSVSELSICQAVPLCRVLSQAQLCFKHPFLRDRSGSVPFWSMGESLPVLWPGLARPGNTVAQSLW